MSDTVSPPTQSTSSNALPFLFYSRLSRPAATAEGTGVLPRDTAGRQRGRQGDGAPTTAQPIPAQAGLVASGETGQSCRSSVQGAVLSHISHLALAIKYKLFMVLTLAQIKLMHTLSLFLSPSLILPS